MQEFLGTHYDATNDCGFWEAVLTSFRLISYFLEALIQQPRRDIASYEALGWRRLR